MSSEGSPRYRNIVITGFMATGKSTIGALVARRLGWRFIDSDAEIVRQAGHEIPAIFADEGEAGFRHREAAVMRALLQQDQQVIATGGGTLINEETRRLALKDNLVVCLTASDVVLARRLSGVQGRPLAANWRALLEARRPVYSAFPHQIDTGSLKPNQAVEEIIRLWQQST
jgi:shikimate kinase